MNLHHITLAFVILKLLDVIAWSWWWVLLPSIIALVLVFIALTFMAYFHKK